MSIQSGDLSAHIERVGLTESVLRVERDQRIDGDGQKEKDNERGRKPPHHAPPAEEDPHDVVEVSRDYHAAESHGSVHPAIDRPSARAQSAPNSHPHLDIKV